MLVHLLKRRVRPVMIRKLLVIALLLARQRLRSDDGELLVVA